MNFHHIFYKTSYFPSYNSTSILNIWWKFITLNFDMIICKNVVQSPPNCKQTILIGSIGSWSKWYNAVVRCELDSSHFIFYNFTLKRVVLFLLLQWYWIFVLLSFIYIFFNILNSHYLSEFFFRRDHFFDTENRKRTSGKQRLGFVLMIYLLSIIRKFCHI
jgi:hypothetical protein